MHEPEADAASSDRLREVLFQIKRRYSPGDMLPAFPDAIAQESPNAACRYLWIYRQLPPAALNTAGQVIQDLHEWRLEDDGAFLGDLPNADEYGEWLDANQGLLDAVCAASRMDRFDLKWGASTIALTRGDETQYKILSAAQRLGRVLRDDAHRRWVLGEPERAIDRAHAMLSMGRQLEGGLPIGSELAIAAGVRANAHALIDQMLDAGIDTPQREMLRNALEEENGHPSPRLGYWRRLSRDVFEFADRGLRTHGGSDSLWHSIGTEADVFGYYAQFHPELDAQLTGFDALELNEQAAEAIIEQSKGVTPREAAIGVRPSLKDITYGDLAASLLQCRQINNQFLRSWSDDNAGELLEEISLLIRSDKTLLAGVLLGGARQLWRSERLLIEQRDALLKRLREAP